MKGENVRGGKKKENKLKLNDPKKQIKREFHSFQNNESHFYGVNKWRHKRKQEPRRDRNKTENVLE